MILSDSTYWGPDISSRRHPSVHTFTDGDLSNDGKGTVILGLSGFFTGFASLVVFLRCYCRLVIARRFAIDDYLIIFAMICSYILLGCVIAESRSGLDQFTAVLTIYDLQELSKFGYIQTLFLPVAICAMKLSFGFLLLRLTETNRGVCALKILMVSALIQGIVHCAIHIFRCVPIPAIWTFSLRASATCIPGTALIGFRISNSGVDAIMDAILVALTFHLFPQKRAGWCRLAFAVMITLGSLYKFRFCQGESADLTARWQDVLCGYSQNWTLDLGFESERCLSGGSIFIVDSCVSMVPNALSIPAAPSARARVVLQLEIKNLRLTDSPNTSIELHVGIVGSSLPTLRPLCKSLFLPSSGPTDDPAIPLARNHDGSCIRMASLSQYPLNRLTHDDDCDPTPRLRSGAAPICEYKVEVSASTLSKSHHYYLGGDGERIDKSDDIDAGHHTPCPGIMRTTDVYVQMDTQGESDRTDADTTQPHDIVTANSRQQQKLD